MNVDDLRTISLFDGLEDDQLAELLEAGTEVAVEPGVELFHEGEHADFWWVLVDGGLDLLRRVGREDTVVGRLDVPGRWAGGFRAWDEHGVYLATGRGRDPGRVLRVPSGALRERFTAWFPFGVHLVEGLYGTARSIESSVRQRASLVTLGTLAAGLAHEINNPAAAATRAAAAMEDASSVLLSMLGRLAHDEISAAQFLRLDELRQELGVRPGLEPLALTDREEAIAEWLEERGVEDAWEVAAPLAAGGADLAWCERAGATLPDTSLATGLGWVASTLSVAGLLAEITEATGRVSELVTAVRSYSQMDRGSLQELDVTDGLESSLVMLGHKMRDGVTVVRQYDDVPHLEAYAGELNQVWTNLIDNAVDAMEGGGTLTLSTSADEHGVVVEVADTGPGMPPDVAERAFEAFYTTKEVGRGTGLGLDIARRIVTERHGGDISVDTGPAGTTMRVRLPLRSIRPTQPS